MSHLGFIWANLRRRRLHNLMCLASASFVFAVYGLALGLAESFRRAALEHHVVVEQQFLLGAIAVSAAGIILVLLLTASAMAHSVRLRLYEFGLLKALGFSRRRIVILIAAEASIPCLAGAILGLVLAKLLFAVLTAMLPPLAALPPPVYTPAIVATGIAIALLVALISTWIPALRIARLDAAAALTGSAHVPPPVRTVKETRENAATKSPLSISAKERHFTSMHGMDPLRQLFIVTRIGLSTLRQRIRGALLIVAGVGCVVFVLLSFLSMAEGIRGSVLRSGDPARIVLRAASTPRLVEGKLPGGLAEIAATAPGVARAGDGSPLVDAEFFGMAQNLIKRNNDKKGYTTVVGVGPHWRAMTPSFRLLTGRMPRPGTHELIAGDFAQRKFSSLDAGTIEYHDAQWKIVGTFTTGGWWDGYLIGHATELKEHASKPADSAVFVTLTSPQAFEAFRKSMINRLPPSVVIERETENYAGFWQSLPKTAIYVAFLLSGLIAAGTIGGVTQIMHTALEERRKEIAVLRVLGFGGMAVASSAVLEAMLLALLGSLAGAAIVWLWLDGNLYNGAWNVFRVTVNLHLLSVAIGCALSIALVGTLPLAIRTVRRKEIDELQSLREVDATNVSPDMAAKGMVLDPQTQKPLELTRTESKDAKAPASGPGTRTLDLTCTELGPKRWKTCDPCHATARQNSITYKLSALSLLGLNPT